MPAAQPANSNAAETSTARLAARARIREQIAYLARQTIGDGAILYGSNRIEPYYANVAATGEAATRSNLAGVRAWMRWYVAHLNAKDRWGLSGTIYDYRYDPKSGRETSMHRADSTDSYAATFFTLARTLYDTGDAKSRAFVSALRAPLAEMGAMVLAIQQSDGMTIALPNYPVAYLMDNCEVYRGLSDLAYLERTALGDSSAASAYEAAARRVAAGIASLWSPSRRVYAEEKQEPSGPVTWPRWTRFYPDATAELFPVLQGVLRPHAPRALALWGAFNGAYPHWDRFEFPDAFPWAMIGTTASIVGDRTQAQVYSESVERKYAPRFQWPWYDMEAGWYLRMLAML